MLSDFNGREGAFTELDVYQALAMARTQVKDIPDNQSLGAFSLMPDPHEGAICATGWRMVCLKPEDISSQLCRLLIHTLLLFGIIGASELRERGDQARTDPDPVVARNVDLDRLRSGRRRYGGWPEEAGQVARIEILEKGQNLSNISAFHRL